MVLVIRRGVAGNVKWERRRMIPQRGEREKKEPEGRERTMMMVRETSREKEEEDGKLNTHIGVDKSNRNTLTPPRLCFVSHPQSQLSESVNWLQSSV